MADQTIIVKKDDDGCLVILVIIAFIVAIVMAIVYAIVGVVMLALSFILCPGMLAMSIIKAILGLDLEPLPMWIFSLISSGVIAYSIWDKFKDFRMTRNVYLSVCGATLLLYLICLGLKFEFSTKVVDNFWGTEWRMPTCIVKVEIANIRAEPSKNSTVIGQARFGDKLNIISESGGWILVRHQNIQGYIYRDLVK